MRGVDTQLLRAAERGDAGDVRRCIQQGANVDIQGDWVSIMHFYVLSYIEKDNLYLIQITGFTT